jgi:hypothetical protein
LGPRGFLSDPPPEDDIVTKLSITFYEKRKAIDEIERADTPSNKRVRLDEPPVLKSTIMDRHKEVLSTTTHLYISSTKKGLVQAELKPLGWVPKAIDRHTKSFNQNRLSVKVRRRLGLPMTFNFCDRPTTIMTCVDSGSEHNAMDLKSFKLLDLQMQPIPSKQFSAANGGPLIPLGTTSVQCTFSASVSKDCFPLICSFYVFQCLATPVIMGMAFLELTETLTKHRERLQDQIVPQDLPSKVMSVNLSRRNLLCQLDGELAYAMVDTGSDLDLLSLEYIISRGLTMQTSVQTLVEFADESHEWTCGFIELTLKICGINSESEEGYKAYPKPTRVEFHVLQNMTTDVIIGYDTEADIRLFQEYTNLFIPNRNTTMPADFNVLRSKGFVDKIGEKAINFCRRWSHREFESPSNATPIRPSTS